MNTLQLTSSNLQIGKDAVIVDVSPSAEWDACGVLRFTAAEPSSRVVIPIGSIPKLRRFTSSHRYEPFWMTPCAGKTVAEVQPETQFLLAELGPEAYMVVVPIVKDGVRCSIEGGPDNVLRVVAETGDDCMNVTEFAGVFIAVGPEPYDLIRTAADDFTKYLGTMRLREDKELPEFVDSFGWCTWDAFYSEVTHDKVREGLQSFKKGGVIPRYLILDDGWQSTRKVEDGSDRLSAFRANEKFPGGLAPTVRMAKEEFGIEQFFVWHAVTGYWGGVDAGFAGYQVSIVDRKLSPGIEHHIGKLDYWGPTIGLVSKADIYRFYQDYHRHLRTEGVDGVKVDVQSQLENVANGHGGRVGLMQAYHEALEGSVHVHFAGNLINCMSLSNDMIYSTLASTLTRSFTDFWPNKPESHGLHLCANAQNSVWFAEFIHPDWDMFQSGHSAGSFHAAGRAVSGGPVYVSDKPGQQNFDLLRKLVLPDGSVLRAEEPAKPTLDCLFSDCTKEDVLLKLFSYNSVGGVIGAFNARYVGGDKPHLVSGSISPSDIVGLEGDFFAVYAHNFKELRLMTLEDQWKIELPEIGWEVFTVVPVEEGFAPIGLPDMLNSGGAIVVSSGPRVMLSFGGRFLAYANRQPKFVTVEDEDVRFTYDAKKKTLAVKVPPIEGPRIQIEF